MISLSLANITLILGSRAIFRDLYWEIQHDQRIGLIGPNGAGKSSLFKVITGEYTPEPGGSVVRAKGVTIGYLAQQPELDLTQTAFELALAGNPRVAELEAELAHIEASFNDPKVYNNNSSLAHAIDRQQRNLEEYDSYGGENYPERVRAMLRGLGLPDGEQDKPIEALSGGQKKLVGLARLILAQPSLLLLDEPDNHLDLPGKVYLEQLVRDYPGAVVIVSHDRYLLDAVITHITEIEDGKLSLYAGDYSSYIVDKEARLARQEELYQIQQRSIARMEMALKRYLKWVQVSDKFASRVHAMEARLERVDRLDKPTLERRKMGLELNGWRGSTKVLALEGIAKSFGASVVLRDIQLLVQHGERVGLIGANGAGKSVLLRLILGIEQPTRGEIYLGPSVKMGYYAQEHETLNFDQTLIEAVRRASPLSEHNAVAFLLRYLFTYPQMTQQIGLLSGGERSRLQLALLVLSGANFLLLDEPTNNLDIASAEVLENALEDFVGAVLVISHDRYFLDRTVQRIVELKHGKLTEYLGGYSDYVEHQAEKSVE